MKTKERNQAVDLIKIIAMCMVVALHTTRLFDDNGLHGPAFVAYYTSDIGIPLFFAVSGYLLLGRDNSTYSYVWRKLWHIVRFVLIFSTLMWCVHLVHNSYPVSDILPDFYCSIVQGGHNPVLWFLWAMALVYLAYPVINRIYKEKRRAFIGVFCVMAALCVMAFTLNAACGYVWEGRIPQTFRLYLWLFYFMLGAILKNIRIGRAVAIAAVILLFAANLWQTWMLSGKLFGSEYFYGSPVTMLFTASVILLCKDLRIHNNRFIALCSTLFFPVYVFHEQFIGTARRITCGLHIYDSITLWLATLLLTAVASWILMKIPIVRKLFSL